MKLHFSHLLILIFLIFISFSNSQGQNLTQQWKDGLSGSRLTALSGSIHSSNSSLTVLEFCPNGRYRYYKEGSWNVPGTAGGASNSTITGYWDIVQGNGYTYLTYRTDSGDQGSFPIYLTANWKVNIGGTLFSVEQRAASCF